jgi:hypothetical protein
MLGSILVSIGLILGSFSHLYEKLPERKDTEVSGEQWELILTYIFLLYANFF